MEMVITLNFQAIEVKRSRHTAQAVVSLKHHGLMSIFGQLVSHSQAHGACAQYGDFLFHSQNSMTILL